MGAPTAAPKTQGNQTPQNTLPARTASGTLQPYQQQTYNGVTNPYLTSYANQADFDAGVAAWEAQRPEMMAASTPPPPGGPTSAAMGSQTPPSAQTLGTSSPPPPTQPAQHTLPQQVQGAYTGALDQFGNVANAGNALLNNSQGGIGQAGDLWSQLAGPGGQLNGMDLSGYMNPYTENVIDTSMNRLNQQEGVQQQGVDDQFARQNAFGGDRMYLQKGVLGGKFADTKANMLSDLYSKNFQNAQSMGQFDIGAKQNTAQGAGQFGLGQAQLGGELARGGAGGMGDLASSGFQMANAANASQVAAAQAQQAQQQQAIDAANANYARLLGIPQEYLQAMMGISSGLGNFGTTKTNTQQDPGALSQIGAGVGILGQIAGMAI